VKSYAKTALILLALSLLCHCSDGPTIPNSLPVLSPVASRSLEIGQTLSFTVTAIDPDGVIPVIYAAGLPAHASFTDGHNGLGQFSFTPDTGQAGQYDIIFIAFDGELADSETITITVLEAGPPVNYPPVLAAIGPQTARVGDTLRLTISASDQDGTVPSLYAENLPDHSSFTPAGDGSGLFMFTPDTGQIGANGILFYASDGELADSETVMVSVLRANKHSPILQPIAPQPCVTTIELCLTVAASDSDATATTLAAYNLPPNAAFVDSGNARGGFSFTPDSTQLGIFEPVFVASDGELADTESVTIAVAPYKPSELWPMAVGNYWVYETSDFETDVSDIIKWWDLWDSTSVRIDSVHVQSCSQRNGIIRWFLAGGTYVTVLDDSVACGDVMVPLVWQDRAVSVPAGIYEPTFRCCTLHGLSPSFDGCVVFAKGVGIVKEYSRAVWSYDAFCSVSRLVRYHIK
jgi:hypothetical protein